jgi:hypothetical protein
MEALPSVLYQTISAIIKQPLRSPLLRNQGLSQNPDVLIAQAPKIERHFLENYDWAYD